MGESAWAARSHILESRKAYKRADRMLCSGALEAGSLEAIVNGFDRPPSTRSALSNSRRASNSSVQFAEKLMDTTTLDRTQVRSISKESRSTRLSDKRLGHLRHFDNLSRNPVNDWSLMGTRMPGQEDFSSLRFQLSYMIYAAALTHIHHLPAAPGLFQPMIQRLMNKLLAPEVWIYWKDTSRGYAPFNAHISDTYVEQWDPVVRDNIMYSAYVQSCALLHDYLFASDRYAKKGSLTFHHWTPLWGGDAKHFEYDRSSLNERVYWQMVKNGYLGVACEPNCIFQICNQPAILGFRLHDLIAGGNRAGEVIASYEQAWRDFGRLDSNGHYNTLMLEDSHQVVPNVGAWADGWCGTLMNMWNREFVREHYPKQVKSFLIHHSDGTISVRPTPKTYLSSPADLDWCDFGWVLAWATEVGDTATRDGILAYADRHMNPTWRDGGLYYPRNDTEVDEDGHYVEMDPMVGNVLIGMSRLNGEDSYWRLFNEPLADARLSAPAVTKLDRNVDLSQAIFHDDQLDVCTQLVPGVKGDGQIKISRAVAHGKWRLIVDGKEIARLDDSRLTPASTADQVSAMVVDEDLQIGVRSANAIQIALKKLD